jgi:hypothetical protein
MQQKISEIQAKYAHELMEKENVVGVGIGLAKENGEYTDELALVVLVEQKMPLGEIAEADRIPSEIEGVRVDVQETGPIEAQ